MSTVATARTAATLGTAEKTFAIAVFGYSVARALPLWSSLAEGGVNPWAFLTIDIVTAWPYARAWPMLIRSLRARDGAASMWWVAVLAGTFAAPYAYVAAVGEDVPTVVWVALAVFACVGVASGARKLYAAVRGGAR